MGSVWQQFPSTKQRRFTWALVIVAFIMAASYVSNNSDLRWSHSPLTSSTEAGKPPALAQPGRKHKDAEARPLANRPFKAISETFPKAVAAKSSSDLPPIPAWNTPPKPHVTEVTPIFIGFTRNWPLLQQTVVSLLTAGWPPEDIYVVENTGVMDANQKGQLTLQNPFYLDHKRLTKVFGVNVMTTPSLQTFAQLQNLYLHEAIKNGWPHYFWAHMDILVQSAEDREPYKSFYMRCVDALRRSTSDQKPDKPPWALRYFAYDWVALMNTKAMVDLGGWDTMISYYTTDCDLYERMRMSGMSTEAIDVGPVYDAPDSLEDLEVLYRVGDKRGSQKWRSLQEIGKEMGHRKNTGKRNRWQEQQMGGQGEPYSQDLDGFAEALELTIQAGVSVYKAKWGGAGCSLQNEGLKLEDEWRVIQILKDGGS